MRALPTRKRDALGGTLSKASSQGADRGQIMVIYEIAAGLKDLAVGLRATYMLLEEVKALASRPRSLDRLDSEFLSQVSVTAVRAPGRRCKQCCEAEPRWSEAQPR
jgi:hypothetical protein